MLQRKISRISTPEAGPGFLGTGHIAVPVVYGDFQHTDPFIFLMDDQLDLPGGPPVGGPHPHAGFETVTLVLEGDDTHFKTGSLEIMTAGKGIIHTEEITSKTKMRIMQLWLVLPPEKRWTEPFLQVLEAEHVPVFTDGNNLVRVYSGSSQGLTSPLRNQTPFTLIDFTLEKDYKITQELPASYYGFVYVLEGSLKVGETTVRKGQTASFDAISSKEKSSVLFAAEENTRFLFYAGEPQGARIVSYGPFIGDSQDDIVRLYREYREGKMNHLNDLDESRVVRY